MDKEDIKLMQPVLQAKAINKRYGKVVALDNADLELYKDEVLGVIGDNGAGTVSYTHLTLPTIAEV